jgi:hypothetical protein
LNGALHGLLIRVSVLGHIKAEIAQRVHHERGIVDGIVQAPQIVVGVIADH